MKNQHIYTAVIFLMALLLAVELSYRISRDSQLSCKVQHEFERMGANHGND